MSGSRMAPLILLSAPVAHLHPRGLEQPKRPFKMQQSVLCGMNGASASLPPPRSIHPSISLWFLTDPNRKVLKLSIQVLMRSYQLPAARTRRCWEAGQSSARLPLAEKERKTERLHLSPVTLAQTLLYYSFKQWTCSF